MLLNFEEEEEGKKGERGRQVTKNGSMCVREKGEKSERRKFRKT